MALASGTFEVKLQPQAQDDPAAGLGRIGLEKSFSGDLRALGRGVMLTAGSPASGSAAYVAVERVTGALHGRDGSFMLHHRGVMDRGGQALSILVVPGSGTGALAGLSGELRIRVEGGQHFYDFDYQLPE